MEQFWCRFGTAEYPFVLGTDWAVEMVERLVALRADRYIVIADPALLPLSESDAISRLARHAPVHLLPCPIGERGKRLSTVEALLENALQRGATRRSCIVALGGGVTGNIAGMVAALAFRGLPLVHIPTTLLAMLDSVLSLKQAVNASVGKNLIGVYHVPALVLADTAYLRTLSHEHIRSGLCEIVKNALAISPHQVEPLNALLDRPVDDARAVQLVRMGIESKVTVMAADAHERRSGLVLEYGHTVGHAIEHVSVGAMTHGSAVALGMLVEARVARDVTGLSEADFETHVRLIGKLGLADRLPRGAPSRELLRIIGHDNKRGYLPHLEDCAPMVLLEALGQPAMTEGLPLTYGPISLIEEALDDIHALTEAVA